MDTDAIVGHVDAPRSSLLVGGDDQFDGAVRCELDGVVDQVDHDLKQGSSVGFDRLGGIARPEKNVGPGFRNVPSELKDGLLGDCEHVDRFKLDGMRRLPIASASSASLVAG